MSEKGTCGWCSEPAVTEVITVPGRKNRKTAPVCEDHAMRFERDGQITTRLEFDRKQEAAKKRSQWRGRSY